MAVKWLKNDNGNEDDQKQIEIKPEDINKAIKPELDAMRTSMSTDLDSKLKPIADYIAAQQLKEQKTEEARRATESRRNQENLEVKPEDWLENPDEALDKKLQPLMNTVQAQSAIIVRNEVLGKMDLYSTDPTFKAKVDAYIDAQPMNLRSNSALILNAYKSVFFDHKEDISEGKFKSFASMTALSNNGVGGHSGSAADKNDETLSEDEKRYAAKLGVSAKDWVNSRREMEYV